MKKFFTLIGIMAATALLGTSCVHNEPTPNPTKEGEVTFTASVSDGQFQAGDAISVTALDGADFYAENSMYTYAAEKFSAKSPICLSDGQSLSYRAVSPYVSQGQDGAISFTVKQSQDQASNYAKSDLMTAFAEATSSETPALAFEHMLAKVFFNIVEADVETSDAVASLEAKTSVDFNILSCAAISHGEAQKITMAQAGADKFKAIVVPQTIAKGTHFGTVTIAGQDYPLVMDKDTEFKVGKEYSYDIKLDNSTASFEGKINDWENGGDGGIEEPTEGWKYLGKAYIDDMVSLAFFNGKPAKLLVAFWEDYANRGYFKLETPYDGYKDVWTNIYGLDNQLPIVSLNAKDVFIDATNPEKVVVDGGEDGLCPLGLKVKGIGDISVLSFADGAYADSVITFPINALGLNITDGSALGGQAGNHYMNGGDAYVIDLPSNGEEPEGSEGPDGPGSEGAVISGGVTAYWDGAELAASYPQFADYSKYPIVAVEYEVSEATLAYYSAVLPDAKEGELEAYTPEQILSTLISQGVKSKKVDDPDNLSFVSPFNSAWNSKIASLAIPVDKSGNAGNMLIQYITFTKDGCADIDDLIDLMSSPALDVQVPFAPTVGILRLH